MLRPGVGFVLRLLVVVVLTGASLAGVVHTVGRSAVHPSVWSYPAVGVGQRAAG